MLRILREHASSWMLRGILILVAVTFISWGGYSLIREKKVTYAAKVDKVEIDIKEYSNTFQAMLKQYRDAMGPSFSEKMVEELKLREKALDSLINQVLISQEAERLGFEVSDEELRQSIESIPYFNVNGQFDRRAYERFLRANHLSPEEFERMQREGLRRAKVINLIRLNAGKVSEEEVLGTYQFENERINLAFVKVSPDALRGQVKANDIDEKDYYQKHQEEFREPTQVRVQYVAFRPADFEGKVQISEEEIKRAYEQQKERFKIPKRVKAREILIKVAPDDKADKIEEKRRRAEEILEKAKKTKDFAALARQYSESSSAPRGGEIGWIQRGSLEESLEAAILTLKAGEVSGLVKGRSGFYIFRADEIQEEKERSLEEVKGQLVQGLKREKAKKEASRKAEDAFYSLFRSRELETYAREQGLPIRTTGFFREGDEIPEIGREAAFHSNAFSLKTGEMSAVVTIPPNFYLLKCVEKKESRIPPFEEVRAAVREKVTRAKADEKARQMAEELLKQAQSGKALRELAQERGLPMEETGFFTRTGGVVPKVGPVGDSLRILASLTERTPVAKEVLKTKDGYFVVKLVASEPADPAKFEEAKKNLERRLALEKEEEFFQRWLDQLREKTKIEINKEILKS